MNKMRFSTTKKTYKRPQNIRVIYKNRNSHKEQYSTGRPVIKKSSFSVTQSRLTPIESDQQSIQEVKSFIKNRLKTQYRDNYRGFPRFSSNQTTNIPRDFSHRLAPKQLKTLEPPHNHPQMDTYNPQKARFKTEADIQAGRPQKHRRLFDKETQSVDKIQRNLQSQVDKRLKIWLATNQPLEFDTQSDIDSLIAAMKVLNCEQNDQEDVNEGIEYSDKKIELLERMMASKNVSAQILKKHFFSKIAKPKLKTHRVTSQLDSIQLLTNKMPQKAGKKDSIVNLSTNKSTFQRPDKSAYRIQRKGPDYFSNDRHKQPLPRSSYSRQFLNFRGYSPLPSSKPADYPQSNTTTTKNVSSYKKQFINKTAERINHKELDAYHNKIKNLPICFGRKQKEQVFRRLARYVNQKNNKKIDGHIEVPFLKSSMLTESRRQYGQGMGPASKIKHKNLHKVKYQIKNLFHV